MLPNHVRVEQLSANAALHRRILGILLDDGEAEALALAIEVRAELILLDQRAANRVARRLGLRPLGLIGVLIEAKAAGHIGAIAPLLDELNQSVGFWLSKGVRAQALPAVGETESY